MSQRRHLLSALAALTLGSAQAGASEPPVAGLEGPGAAQQVMLPAFLLPIVAPFDLAAELARVAALTGASDDQLVRRLGDCLRDNQLADGSAETLQDLVWRHARSLECLATVQLAQAPLAQVELY